MSMDSNNHTTTCPEARGLLPGYLDGELTEEQASPLREHLLACQDCRTGAADHKNLSRWFAAEAVAVPDGFAARVARRAFAGDPGTTSAPLEVEPTREFTLVPFVLKLTAAAAVLLFGLSLLLRGSTLPTHNELSATDVPPWERERLEAQQPPSRADLPAETDLEAEDPSEVDAR